MKKTIFAFLAVAGFGLASAQTISFDKTTFDYGNVKSGSDGHRFFTVKNTGDKPLIISEVKPSCGCTTPEWSKDPILPGKSAKIKVGYNTGLKGIFSKSIEVFSNDPANNRSVIFIKGNVEDAGGEQLVAAGTAQPMMQAKAVSMDATPKMDAQKTRKQAPAAKK